MGEGLLKRVARVVGTPVYVYDAAHIRARYWQITETLGKRFRHRLHYAVKANSNLAILSLLRSLGAGADIVSVGELRRAQQAGFTGEQIVFSGVGKRADELEAALAAGVGLVNVESAAEVEALAGAVARRGVRARVGIRVNPDVTADTHPYTATGERGVKFGVPIDEAVAVAKDIDARPGLTLVSVGMHVGSQIADSAPYAEGARKIIDLVRRIREAGITTLEDADVGGGFAIRYNEQGSELDLEAFCDAVEPLADATGLTVLIEPGRYLVGAAGVLLTRVLYRKRAGGREIVVVDGAMNDLLRPSLYGATHGVTVLEGGDGVVDVPTDVVGPICETGDFLARDRRLAGLTPGALVAITEAGAYGFTMSSNYNSRPRAAEVLVDGERYAVIRDRETLDDLVHGEHLDPEWRT